MSNLYDVLEICLQEIENGADVDTVLFRYPEHAEELRPILGASVQAGMLAAPDPSAEVMHRGRAKILQRAAQLREAQSQPSHRFWTVSLRRALVSLAVIAVFFISSTSLVRAASTTLPGDNLYPVKRTWEDVLVLLTFNIQARQALQVEHENERLNELSELLAEKRSAKVEFAGTVMSQDGDLWLVSKVLVQVSSQTELQAPVKVGDAVRVEGFTQADGTVLAKEIKVLAAGIPLPDMDEEEDHESEQKPSEATNGTGDDNSNSGSQAEDQTPEVVGTESTQESSSSEKSSVEGVVDSIDGNVLMVGGQSMDISGAEIKGSPQIGASVKVEGYYDANGVFIVTRIEFQDSGSDSGGSGSDGSQDSSDDHNDNGSDGGGDDSGGGGNSGSGGGGDD